MSTTYHLGQRVKLSVVIQVDGVDTDPFTGMIAVRRKEDSDSEIKTYPLIGGDTVKDAVGRYHMAFLPDQAGDWYYATAARGATGNADEQTSDEVMFKVAPSQFPDAFFLMGKTN